MSGPLPKPYEIKEAEGFPGHVKSSKPPTPKTAMLVNAAPPAHLSEGAKLVWTELAAEYIAAGLLYKVDCPGFCAYCEAIADARRFRIELEAEGFVTYGHNKKGEPYSLPNPKYSMWHQSQLRMHKFGMGFGDSPAARAKLGMLNANAPDDLDKYLADDDAEGE